MKSRRSPLFTNFLIALSAYPLAAFCQPATPAAEPEAETEISNFQFGVGLGVEHFDDPYIETAKIYGEQKVVTIEKSRETLPSVWLNINWNIWPREVVAPRSLDESGVALDVQKIKYGFFAGVKVLDSASEAFSAFAIGPQVSFVTQSRVISLGLGAVNHTTRTFANGIVEGQSLPERYDDIHFEERTDWSWTLMLSMSF